MRALVVIAVLLALPALGQENLEREVAAARAALEGTRAQAVALAAQVQGAEADLMEAERRQAALEAERGRLRAEVASARRDAEPLLAALARLGRVPQGALLAAPPDGALDAARAGMVLGALTREAEKRLAALGEKTAALDALEVEVEGARAAAAGDARALREQAAALGAVEARRSKALESLEGEHAAARAEADRAAREARDFAALLQHLDRPAAAPEAQLTPPLALPIAGVIALPFGAADALGAPAQGLTLAGRPGGLVTAPASGTVRFAGTFRAYGNLVIVEHAHGHHSLLAGLGAIATAPGARVEAGEPIGTLPPGGRMYYEIRHAGRPLDPATKIGKAL